jgi:plasmid stability protein
MPTIQVRNVPESVHRTLRSRAAAAGQSLQEYVLEELTDHAQSRDIADVIAEARAERLRQPSVTADLAILSPPGSAATSSTLG